MIIAAIIGAGFGYWAYVLSEDGFEWYSIFPGLVAFLMGIAILGMFSPQEQTPEAPHESPPPEAG
jgi:hypothetical protein